MKKNVLHESALSYLVCGLVLLFTGTAARAYPCTYYIDATAGNDNNTGLTEAGAWRTLGKVNSVMADAGLQAGDTVCLKRGEVWREQLTIIQSGEAGAPLTFGAYGSGANPLIVSSDPIGWWQYSIMEGGFERFEGDLVDVDNANFPWPWYETPATNAYVGADPDNALLGNYAVKLTRLDAAAGNPVIRSAKGVNASTQHYLRFNAKTSGDAVLSVRIRDDQDGTPDYWLQEDLVTWSTTSAVVATVSSADWASGNLTFTTRPESNRLDVRFELMNGVGSAWVDEVIVVEGAAEPAQKIWHGRFVDASVGKIYGLQDKGQRVPTRDDISDPALLSDREAISDSIGILYRRDDGDLTDIEVGRRVNAIRVESQNNIVIDAIDTRGAGARPAGVTGEEFGPGLVFIAPGSSSVTVQNSTASQSSSGALSAGIYLAPDNPTDIVYDNVVAYDNQSTGLYIRGAGRISNSLTYNNGTLDGDTGDRGGIGLQEGPAVIEGNEIHTLGQGDRDIDYAISICCGIKGNYEIRSNHVHDVSSGALQIAGSGQPFNHVIEYNIFERFGQNSTTESVTYGKFAGVRLVDAPATRVNNNVIAYGGPHPTANGVLLRNNAQDVVISNNLFMHNQQADIRGVYGVVATGWISNNNAFWRADFSNAWWWESTQYSSLVDWQQALQQDSLSLDSDPVLIVQAPVSANDYLPSPGSPLVDAGAVFPAAGGDYSGNPIVAAADIGAHEYGSNNFVQSEVTEVGSRIGSFSDIAAADGVYESITEYYNKLKGGLSQLEHRWIFGDIPVSPSMTLYVLAHHTPNAEGDDFLLQYRTPGGTWQDLLTVVKTQPDAEYQTATLSGISGQTVELRAIDTDQTKKNIGLDTLYVDHLFLRSH